MEKGVHHTDIFAIAQLSCMEWLAFVLMLCKRKQHVISASVYVLRWFVYCVTMTVYLWRQITLLPDYCSSAGLACRWLGAHCSRIPLQVCYH